MMIGSSLIQHAVPCTPMQVKITYLIICLLPWRQLLWAVLTSPLKVSIFKIYHHHSLNWHKILTGISEYWTVSFTLRFELFFQSRQFYAISATVKELILIHSYFKNFINLYQFTNRVEMLFNKMIYFFIEAEWSYTWYFSRILWL